MNTTTSHTETSPDALRLWLKLVEDKLAGGYDNGELHRLVIECDIDPLLTSESAEAFADIVSRAIGSGQLAGMIRGGHFANLESEPEVPEPSADRDNAAAMEIYAFFLHDESHIAQRRKDHAEFLKTRVVDSIANMIIGEAEGCQLPVNERHAIIDAIIAGISVRIDRGALVNSIVDMIAADVENRHLPVEQCLPAVDDILFAVNARFEGGTPLATIG